MRAALGALLLPGCTLFLDFGAGLPDASAPDAIADARVDALPDGPPVDAGDRYEPNDTFETSTRIVAGTTSGVSIRPAGDRDFYVFTTSGLANTRIEITFVNLAGDLDLAVHDSTGAVIHRSDGAADTEVVDQPLAAGDWTAEVYGAAGIQENDYSLNLVTP